jgi:hypothetical protein
MTVSMWSTRERCALSYSSTGRPAGRRAVGHELIPDIASSSARRESHRCASAKLQQPINFVADADPVRGP